MDSTRELAIDYRPIGDLISFAVSARTHSEAQVGLIAGSIREYCFTNPLLVDGKNGIIAGHGRVMAARKLGLMKVTVIELAHLSKAQNRAYILADKKLTEQEGWEALSQSSAEQRSSPFKHAPVWRLPTCYPANPTSPCRAASFRRRATRTPASFRPHSPRRSQRDRCDSRRKPLSIATPVQQHAIAARETSVFFHPHYGVPRDCESSRARFRAGTVRGHGPSGDKQQTGRSCYRWPQN